jgi:hypothetical protein
MGTDPLVEQLRKHFLEHPVWVEAAKPIREGAESLVLFTHVPGIYHLHREGGKSLLLQGRPKNPDFGFRFTPRSIELLTSTEGDIGDYAVMLFSLITHPDPQTRIGFRVYASFPRLLKMGYVQVLLRGGPKVLQYSAQRGVRTVGDLIRLFQELREKESLEGSEEG